MRILTWALLALSTLLLPFSANALDANPITIGQSYKLPSETLADTREINVWLPPGYAQSERTYPVLYVIDGGLKQDFHHITGLAQLATINGTYETLIVVGVTTDVRIRELTSMPQDPRFIREPRIAGDAAVFRRFLAEEVLPFIAENFRVSKRKALIGESLAGLFVSETFLKTPALFSDYISISPSMWWDGKALGKQAAELLQQHDNTPRRLYLTMANEGGTMQNGLDDFVAALKAHAPEALQWQYIDRSDSETHASIYHGAAHDALHKLFATPHPPSTEPPPWYMIEGGTPPQN